MRPLLALLMVLLLALGACSGDDGRDLGAGATAEDPEITTTAPDDHSTAGTATALTTTTTPAQGEDGIVTPEDAAAFLVTSWFDGDREAALRHADTQAVDDLFAEPAPPVESLEFVECDSSDLETFDCFFTVDGRPLIVEVEVLRVTSVDFDAS